MSNPLPYDVTVIGGGLAGLAASILLSRSGYSVALFEKEHYPFHKVCGEYISLESWSFLERLGLPLKEWDLPIIKKLEVSAPNGNYLHQDLPLGGFGISRFKLDNELKHIAVAAGVKLHEDCRVEEIKFENGQFHLKTSGGNFRGRVCCGTFGKRSNIDLKLKRDFVNRQRRKLDNLIAVKYHIKTDFAADTIALHNFQDGYCGISKIEGEKFCLCYLTTAANLRASANSIAAMERNILYKNSYLQAIFEQSEMLYKAPLTISQVSFSKKTQVSDHILMLGDAAGMITPLCGNGMSMALHSAKLAHSAIVDFLESTISRENMELNYQQSWRQQFAGRLATGRMIQLMFGREWVTNRFIECMKLLPSVTGALIRRTHGLPF